MITLISYPVEHYLLCIGRTHIVDSFENFNQFLHDAWSVFLPTLLDVLLCICLGSNEEEITLRPEILNKLDATFDHANGFCNIVHTEIIGTLSMLGELVFQDWHKQFGKCHIVHTHEILMIEPDSLLIVELCACL